MTSASFNYFQRIDITLATYTAGAKSTITVSVVNKPLKDSASVATYWPILQTVGDVSLQAGEFLPTQSVGSIKLDNTIGSFGANRKFSDLFQRYSPVEQDVTIYVGVSANDSDTVSSWTQIALVKCSTYEHGANGGTLSLNVSPFRFDEKVVTLEVADTVAGMENAPESSLGRVVPLVLGGGGSNNFVAPIRITADGGTAPAYAVATGFSGHLQVPDLYPVAYFKDYDDRWVETDMDTALVATSLDAETPTGSYTLNTYAARAFSLGLGSQELVSGVTLRCKANNSGARTSTALLSVSIIRVDITTRAVVAEEGVGRVDLSYYDTLNNNLANTNFQIKVSFDRPVLLVRDTRYAYYLTFAVTGFATNELSLNYTSLSTTTELRKDTGDANNSYAEWRLASTAASSPLYGLMKVSMGSFTNQVAGSTQTGLTYSKLTLAQGTPDTGQQAPPLDTLQFLVEVEGASLYPGVSTITAAQSVLSKLSYTWNGTAWTDPATWDVSTFSSRDLVLLGVDSTAPTDSVRGRSLRAVYDSRTTFSQVAADVCRGLACRVGALSTGKMFLHPWGYAITEAADILAADVIPLSWQQRDASTIVNRCVITFGRSPLFSSNTGAEQIPDGYEFSRDYSAANYPYIEQFTAESRALYGQRDLANGTLNAHNGNGGSAMVAEYYLTRFAKPQVYASFVVPWHRYSTLRMFDVVRFQHPEFPSYFGSDPEPPQPVVDTGSTVERVEPNGGYEWVRAEPYRGLIEGISYVLAAEHAPAIRLTVLVLLNQPWDPT